MVFMSLKCQKRFDENSREFRNTLILLQQNLRRNCLVCQHNTVNMTMNAIAVVAIIALACA
ncbi:hypothetical protein DERP_001731 [Dermatophagoides pteronyssinus]|uniref:Uncharacterized protein n=1 Tax=Dermatophagoides pteronyssinus TaxID=6956 RepID=A0ABQ8JBW8_DERPT|nr:hypothetical protein DERP_001731 [Dermatophagoides pteronyssinus]